MIRKVKDLYVRLGERYPTHTRIFRFLLSGGTALLTDLAVLYLFTDVFGVWYLASAVIAFIFAFFVSFLLHKFWTFGDHSREDFHTQMSMYFFITVINLALNTLLMYLLVEKIGLQYIVAQIAASALIAVGSFFTYQRFVFRRTVTI